MVEWGCTKKLLSLNLMGKYVTKMNTTSENMTYLVHNKKNMCQQNKLHPLKHIKVKWTSEIMHRDIEKLFSMIYRNTSLHRVKKIYQIVNRLIVRLNMISFVAQIVINHFLNRVKRK